MTMPTEKRISTAVYESTWRKVQAMAARKRRSAVKQLSVIIEWGIRAITEAESRARAGGVEVDDEMEIFGREEV